jgi:hypothetical protein
VKLFLLYINDLPGSINNLCNLSKLTLFVDDTNIIFTHPNPMEFEEDINKLFEKIIIWFQINLLSLNLNKSYSACYVIRSLKSLLPLETLRMICFSSIHSIIPYGIIFGGNSSYINTIFKLQKRVIRIMINAENRESCRQLFKKLNILPLHSQYILSLLLFLVKNINMFKLNLMVHSIILDTVQTCICPQCI